MQNVRIFQNVPSKIVLEWSWSLIFDLEDHCQWSWSFWGDLLITNNDLDLWSRSKIKWSFTSLAKGTRSVPPHHNCPWDRHNLCPLQYPEYPDWLSQDNNRPLCPQNLRASTEPFFAGHLGRRRRRLRSALRQSPSALPFAFGAYLHGAKKWQLWWQWGWTSLDGMLNFLQLFWAFV